MSGRWYALFVATGNEDKVKGKINFKLDNQLRVVVLKRKMIERKEGKWEEKLRTLFPGYILLNGYMDQRQYEIIRDIPGVIRILRDNCGPQEISETEMELISRLTADSEIIGISRVYTIGNRVMVADGPLLGMEGFIKSIDKRKGRVKVVVNLLGEPRVVELSVTMVQSA